jgi:hypothetical protein
MRGLYHKRNTQQRGIFWALENTDRGARDFQSERLDFKIDFGPAVLDMRV